MAYGAILGQTPSSNGKRICRFTVGTSTAGWTAADCDYLCDGTADDVEINAAIQALPATGGEVVILDGTYNITATIAMNKDNVKLSGNGAATILKRMWKSSSLNNEGVITVTAINGGCSVNSLQVDGNMATYSAGTNHGIYISASNNNTVTDSICNNNNDNGIFLNNSNNSIIAGNICNSNGNYGIWLASDNSIITGNTCNDNTKRGININGNNSTVTGNTCNNNGYGIYLSTNGNNSTVTGNTCNNNSYGIYMFANNSTITGNTCNNNSYGIYMFANNGTVTGNTCNNNGYGIYMSSSDNNAITGNTCIRGTGQTSDYTSSQYTIRLNGTDNNYNLIADNNIMGKNYTSSGGTNNTFVNNKFE